MFHRHVFNDQEGGDLISVKYPDPNDAARSGDVLLHNALLAVNDQRLRRDDNLDIYSLKIHYAYPPQVAIFLQLRTVPQRPGPTHMERHCACVYSTSLVIHLLNVVF